ncbi:MAG: hypothetical protein JWR11_4496 [Mycobacterium sp.]|jgi:hypothetical protein|nr:hypothetical protein [Mycobacterium sp.]MDT5070046.1 hypothetical protein [Mycobacterium sp.]
MTVERSRSRARHCAVAITIDEVDDRTRAVARMNWQDRPMVGVGQTRSAELLPDRAAERLSVSRALSDLVTRLSDRSTDAPRE